MPGGIETHKSFSVLVSTSLCVLVMHVLDVAVFDTVFVLVGRPCGYRRDEQKALPVGTFSRIQRASRSEHSWWSLEENGACKALGVTKGKRRERVNRRPREYIMIS